ncbi:hypothetical protein SLEP1_g7389 [Rubroshorea leprosula]|uniref:Uncharacterized protein n=1 Tax=Rubroshorea leprosula TaxID=152421 RepID=A0AAV5I6J0_9ROSI|nr:hypothetical protein SLEP1_g7389 [Rubroshorea leprosula]
MKIIPYASPRLDPPDIVIPLVKQCDLGYLYGIQYITMLLKISNTSD